MLTQAEVVPYVLGRRLIGPSSVVEGDVVVRDLSTRNCNFTVERRHGPSYLLKQGVTAEEAATVAHEAQVYATLWSSDTPICRYVPRFHQYEDGILVLEFVGEGRNLHEHHARRGRFPVTLAAAMGRVLGVLHATTWRPADDVSPERAPWVLSLHRPGLDVFRDMSAASLDVIKAIQAEPAFGEQLDELRAGWRQQALLHSDVKWDNFILDSRPGTRARGVKLIDWETAGRGNPSWDIGSVFAHYLSFWLASIPVTGDVPPEEFPLLARHPLDSMQPAMAACWRAYCGSRRFDADESARWLAATVRFAGARLVQAAVESAQGSMHLTGNVVLHLQLAFNMLLRPREAAVHLLGIR